jgi:alpha-ribazole phosphatase
MEVYLIRHTYPEIEEGICYGQTDLLLRKGYENDIQEVISSLNQTVDQVYSSPSIRCKILAGKIDSNNPIIYDERLLELDFGLWEMESWAEIPEEELNPWMENFVEAEVPEGESYRQLFERVLEFWTECIKDNTTNKIAIVTHAGTIRAMLPILENIPLEKTFETKVEYGEVKKFII